MSASYTCRSCRLQLLRRGSSFLERTSHPIARYSTSYGNPPRPPNLQPSTRDPFSEPDHRAQHDDDFFVRSPEEQQLLEQIRQPRNRGRDRHLEDLFSASLSGSQRAEKPRISSTTGRQDVASKVKTGIETELAGTIAELQQLLISSTPTDITTAIKLWRIFKTKLLPGKENREWTAALRIDGYHSAPHPVFSEFIRHIVVSWCHNPTSELPSPTQLRLHLRGLHLLLPSSWERMVWPMVMSLYESRASAQQDLTSRPETEIMDELIALWRYLFLQFAPAIQGGSESSEWPAIPSPASMKSSAIWKNTTFYHRFFDILRKYPAPPMRKASSLPAAALASLDLLGRRLDLDSIESAKVEHFPFLMLIANMAFKARRGVKYDLLRNITDFSASPNAASNLTDLLDNLPFIIGRIRALTASLQPLQEEEADQSSNASVSSLMTSLWAKRIGRVEEARDGARLHRLWNEACSEYTSEGAPSRLQMPEVLFELFLRAAFKLRQFEMVTEVFETMIATYGKITRTMTWNTLLQMLQQKRDDAGMDRAWQAMIMNGAKPNSISWAIRIHAIISAKRVADGLAMLEEMDRTWQDAAMKLKGLDNRKARPNLTSDNTLALRSQVEDTPGAPRVDTNVINVTLSALIRTRKMPRRRHGIPPPPPQDDPTIHRVLEWAASRGIQPNVTTYNLFIGDALHHGNGQEVSNVLQTMEERNIQPDSYTLSHLLNARFRSSSTQVGSEEEMATSVTGLLSDFQNLGLHLNAHHYSILVDGLLRRHNNPKAARAVLAYMRANGMQPTPYIYTMLATYYFSQNPPAVDAVAALCQDMRRMDDMLNVSSHFFGRVIEGYARINDLGNMMAMFNQMAKDNRPPTWLLLQVVIRKFVEIDERATAESIFEDVCARRGPMRHGIYGSRQQRKMFWQQMSELGFKFQDHHEQQYEALFARDPSILAEEKGQFEGSMPMMPESNDELSQHLQSFSDLEVED
jgi:hypothetical protein